jgi:hypothetical protein
MWQLTNTSAGKVRYTSKASRFAGTVGYDMYVNRVGHGDSMGYGRQRESNIDPTRIVKN